MLNFRVPFLNPCGGVLWCPVRVQKAAKKPECDRLGRLKVLFSIGFYSIFGLSLVALLSCTFWLVGALLAPFWRFPAPFLASKKASKKRRKSIKRGSKKDPGLEPVSVPGQGGAGAPRGHFLAGSGPTFLG